MDPVVIDIRSLICITVLPQTRWLARRPDLPPPGPVAGDQRPELAPASTQARQLDALYRLTRHDALAGLGEALRAFVGAGGTEALLGQGAGQGGAREGRGTGRGGARGLLRLGAQQQAELFVFRDVALQGVEDDCVRVGVEGWGGEGIAGRCRGEACR